MNLELFILENYQAEVSIADLDQFARERVFFNVENPPPISKGGSQSATPGSSITIPVTQTSRGPIVVFYTTSTDSRLGKPFAGVMLEEAVQIVYSMKNVDGLVLQSSREPALAIGKPNFGEVKTR